MQTQQQPRYYRSARLLIVLVAVFVALSLACSNRSHESAPTPVITSAPTTALPMPPLNNSLTEELGWVMFRDQATEGDVTRARIGDYRGSVLVLDLYATWCAPCRDSVPHLIALDRRYRDQGLQIVGLNVGGADDRVKVTSFAREFGISYRLGFPDQALSDLLLSDNATIPQTFVFNREGRLLKRFIGYDANTAASLEQIIQVEAVTKPVPSASR